MNCNEGVGNAWGRRERRKKCELREDTQLTKPGVCFWCWEFEGDGGGRMSLLLRNWVQSIHLAFSLDRNDGVPSWGHRHFAGCLVLDQWRSWFHFNFHVYCALFKTEFHFALQDSLEVMATLLPLPSQGWDYRCVSLGPHLTMFFLGFFIHSFIHSFIHLFTHSFFFLIWKVVLSSVEIAIQLRLTSNLQPF